MKHIFLFGTLVLTTAFFSNPAHALKLADDSFLVTGATSGTQTLFKLNEPKTVKSGQGYLVFELSGTLQGEICGDQDIVLNLSRDTKEPRAPGLTSYLLRLQRASHNMAAISAGDLPCLADINPRPFSVNLRVDALSSKEWSYRMLASDGTDYLVKISYDKTANTWSTRLDHQKLDAK